MLYLRSPLQGPKCVWSDHRREQAKANRPEAAHAERLRPVLTELRELPSRAIAAELTKRAIPKSRGGDWQSRTVMRLVQRLVVIDRGA